MVEKLTQLRAMFLCTVQEACSTLRIKHSMTEILFYLDAKEPLTDLYLSRGNFGQ